MRGLEVGSDGRWWLGIGAGIGIGIGAGNPASTLGITTPFQRDRPVSLPVTAIQPSNAFVAGRPHAVKRGCKLGRLITNHKNHHQSFEA